MGKKVCAVPGPCVELFHEQPNVYDKKVLRNAMRKRLTVLLAESIR